MCVHLPVFCVDWSAMYFLSHNMFLSSFSFPVKHKIVHCSLLCVYVCVCLFVCVCVNRAVCVWIYWWFTDTGHNRTLVVTPGWTLPNLDQFYLCNLGSNFTPHPHPKTYAQWTHTAYILYIHTHTHTHTHTHAHMHIWHGLLEIV